MTSAAELAKAGEAAKSLAAAPLTLADTGAGMEWDGLEPGRFRCVLLDWPLDADGMSDLARVGQLAGVRLFSPVAFYPPRDFTGTSS